MREFDFIAAPNNDSLIRYFREGLQPFIRAQLDARGRDLDSWDEVVEKIVNAEAKTSLQLHSRTSKIDSKYPQSKRSSKAIDKNKFSYISFVNWGGDQMSDKMSDRSPGKKNSGLH